MGLTLNQVQNRIKAIVTAHKMVRGYNRQGLEVEFGNDKSNLYPAVELLTRPGTIDLSGRITTFGFTMMAEDLVHVSKDTLLNEWDVVSDCIQILQDVFAQMNHGNYSDWDVSASNNLDFYFDKDNDRVAGVKIDFSVDVFYTQDVCAVPSDLDITDVITNESNYKVYDLKYIASGNEGTTLNTGAITSLNVLTGKKILSVIRENSPLHKVSNSPDPAEFVWNDTVFTFGIALNTGERLLILYRNY